MMIKKMTASFGKFNGDSLELHDGLNIICAPNESGKSTWCAFIRAMLYGIESSERQRAGYLPDKLKYAPWSGAVMQGEMEVSHGGQDITLARTSKAKNAPMREFAAVYTGTNVAVRGMTGENAGELLTGATKDVFRRSAFIEQGSTAVSGSPELEKRISAIVASGDENCSFTEADEQLRTWQRSRRYNRRGKLPAIEAEIIETQNTLNELESLTAQRDELTEKLEIERRQCEMLESMMMESRNSARKEALANLQNMRRESQHAEAEHDKVKQHRDECLQRLCDCTIGSRRPEDAVPEIDGDIAEAKRLKAVSEKKSSPVFGFVMLFLAVVAAVLGAVLNKYAFAAAGVLAVLGVVLLVLHGRTVNAAHDAARTRKQLLAKYKCSDEDGIRRKKAEYLALYEAFSEADGLEKESAQRLGEVRRMRENTDSRTIEALNFTGESEAALLKTEYEEKKRSCDYLAMRVFEITGRIEAMGDPLNLGSRLRDMQTERTELQAEYDAIELAINTLREADDDIQSRFSPELGRLAAHYMAMVTGGRYESVLINRDFSARTKTGGDSIARETEYLSAGTLDLMYLAVRLAVCKLALPDGEACPLVLDDTLVNFDEERTKQALKLLREIAKERQVILFTCKNLE